MCTAMRGATPVKRCTCAASSAFSHGVRGTPGWPNTLNRVPEFPKAQEGSSISCPFSAALTAVRSRIWYTSPLSGPGSWTFTPHFPPANVHDHPGCGSEVELVDVVGGENERRAEQDGLVRSDRERAQLARGELLTLRAVELARRDLHRRVRGQEAEVVRLPQHELLDGAVGDVLLQRVRRAEPGQRDLAAVLGIVQDGRGRRDPDRGRRDDALQVRVLLEQALGHLGGRGRVVVAVDRRDQLHLRVLLQLLLHVADPLVLVRGRR